MAEAYLTRREEEILLSVLRHYADRRRPVSSADLKSIHSEDISTSSIRSVLNSLENKGYLEKEHVSSGRVPTDLAFRHFAETALRNLQVMKIARGNDTPRIPHGDMRTAAREVARSISERYRSVGFATAPSLMDARLSTCELYPVSRDKIVFVALAQGGHIIECVLDRRHGYSWDHLRSFSGYITQNYRGWSFREIRNHLKIQLVKDREKVAGWVLEALSLIAPAVEQLPSEVELFWDGLEWLVEIPEATMDRGSLKALVEAVEKKEKLVRLLDELLVNGRSCAIALGSDWPLGLKPPSLSLIVVPYGVEGGSRGVVGLIGPKAMKYDEALPNLSSSALLLTEASINLSSGGREIG